MVLTKVKTASPEEYLTARLQLLEKEKALTRAKDEVTRERQNLPLVEVTKQYTFVGTNEAGEEVQYCLGDLFSDRPQLIIYHAMFGTTQDTACASCSLLMSSMGELRHLNSRGVTLVAVSMAPIEKVNQYKKRLGFMHPWVSSNGVDFNYDFCVAVDGNHGKDRFISRSEMENTQGEIPWFAHGGQPGHSVFIKGDSAKGIGEDGKVYHTYSTYARGNESIVPTFAWLDMTLLGRRDEISNVGGTGFKRTDEYTKNELNGRWSTNGSS